MTKFSTIAVAVMASVLAPAVAQADTVSEHLNLVQKLKNAKKKDLFQLKLKYAHGDITKAEYQARLLKLKGQLAKLSDKIEDLKEKKASA